MHDVIGKRKTALDQFINGLKMLDFYEEMVAYPQLFKGLFVQSTDVLDGEKVVKVLVFTEGADTETAKYLKEYLMLADVEKLIAFMVYVTGSSRLPAFGLGKIDVKISPEYPGIQGHTCKDELEMGEFENKELFNTSLDDVLSRNRDKDGKMRSFNCI